MPNPPEAHAFDDGDIDMWEAGFDLTPEQKEGAVALAREGLRVAGLWRRIDDLLAENVRLRDRNQRYERQRGVLAAVIGTTGLMPIDSATRNGRLRGFEGIWLSERQSMRIANEALTEALSHIVREWDERGDGRVTKTVADFARHTLEQNTSVTETTREGA